KQQRGRRLGPTYAITSNPVRPLHPPSAKKSENGDFLHPKHLRQKTIFRAGILHPRFGKLHDPPPKESLP
ncbi:hypothetical protein, partial [Alistipes ihumii]|uniref:hypothetical protein n=1 Tax=Alistipes ihumii TaxID=1470347 RepID=UPI003AB11D62